MNEKTSAQLKADLRALQEDMSRSLGDVGALIDLWVSVLEVEDPPVLDVAAKMRETGRFLRERSVIMSNVGT